MISSCINGSYGANSGAATQGMIIASRSAIAAIAERFDKRRRATVRSPRNGSGSSAIISNPRVGGQIEEVGEDASHRHENTSDDHRRHQQRIVARAD